MRRFLLSALMGLLVLFGSATLASACDNDSQAETQEREFKSDYQQGPGAQMPSYEEESDSNTGSIVAVGAGLMFLAGAVVLTRKTMKSL
jgi:hypothetical protein